MLHVPIDKIVPLTTARDTLSKIIADVETGTPMYILTKNGKPSVAVLSINELTKQMGPVDMPSSAKAPEGGPVSAPVSVPATSTPNPPVTNPSPPTPTPSPSQEPIVDFWHPQTPTPDPSPQPAPTSNQTTVNIKPATSIPDAPSQTNTQPVDTIRPADPNNITNPAQYPGSTPPQNPSEPDDMPID